MTNPKQLVQIKVFLPPPSCACFPHFQNVSVLPALSRLLTSASKKWCVLSPEPLPFCVRASPKRRLTRCSKPSTKKRATPSSLAPRSCSTANASSASPLVARASTRSSAVASSQAASLRSTASFARARRRSDEPPSSSYLHFCLSTHHLPFLSPFSDSVSWPAGTTLLAFCRTALTRLHPRLRVLSQWVHTMCVTSMLPTNMGGGHGKVAVIDTEGGFRPEKIHPIAERFGVKVKHFLCCGLFDLCHLIFLSPFS